MLEKLSEARKEFPDPKEDQAEMDATGFLAQWDLSDFRVQMATREYLVATEPLEKLGPLAPPASLEIQERPAAVVSLAFLDPKAEEVGMELTVSPVQMEKMEPLESLAREDFLDILVPPATLVLKDPRECVAQRASTELTLLMALKVREALRDSPVPLASQRLLKWSLYRKP